MSGVGVTGIISDLPGTITPYPVIDPKLGLGGFRTAADLTARDAIPDNFRVVTMVVVLETDGSAWQLLGGITNADWVPFNGRPFTGAVYVDPGALAGGNGSAAAPFATAQQAITALGDGGTLLFTPGNHSSDISVPGGTKWAFVAITGGTLKQAAITGTVTYNLSTDSGLFMYGLEIDGVIHPVDADAGTTSVFLAFQDCVVAGGITGGSISHVLRLGCYSEIDTRVIFDSPPMVLGPHPVIVTGQISLNCVLVSCDLTSVVGNIQAESLCTFANGNVTVGVEGSSFGSGCIFSPTMAWTAPTNGKVLFSSGDSANNWAQADPPLTNPQVFVDTFLPRYTSTNVANSAGTAFALNFFNSAGIANATSSQSLSITLSASSPCVLTVSRSPLLAAICILTVIQNGNGTGSVTWPSSFKWANASPPVIPSVANSRNQVVMWFDNTTGLFVEISRSLGIG